MFYINARSIVNKLDKFQSLIYANSYDIIGVSEIWLTSEINSNEILPYGFSVYRNDRPSCDGGVMLAIHNSIPCQFLASPVDIEIVCVKLNLQHSIICCVIYIPPNSSPSYYDILFCSLTDICHNPSDIDIVLFLLLGDFNFTDIERNTLSGQSHISQQFCDLIFDIGLINLPTHIKGNTLDLLLINMEDSIDSIKVHSISLLFPSDHYSITFNLSFSKPPVKQATYYSYNYSKGDYQGLYEYLSYLNLSSCFLSHNVEFIWETIELIIYLML